MGAIKPGGTGGGGTSLPATPADALLDAGSPSTMLGLNASGVGQSLSASQARSRMGLGSLATASGVTASQISDATTAGRAVLTAANVAAQVGEINKSRRPAGSSALLWECSELVSPLASTGSVACDLANAGAAVIGFTEPLSPLLGTALRCTGASTSEVNGGAGVYPSTATTTAVTMWALVVIRTMPGTAGCVIARDYGATWTAPFGAFVDILPGGVVRAFAPFGSTPTYDTVSSAAGEVEINRPHLVGCTYDGTTLRVWVDGRAVASKGVDTPLTWGAAGSWRLGANGGGNGLDGSVVRAGVETSVWTQAQWATLYRQTMGAAP